MKKINWLILIGAAGLLAGAAFIPAARAADAPASPGPRHGRWLQQAREKLGLSDDQLQRIRHEPNSLRPRFVELREAGKGNHRGSRLRCTEPLAKAGKRLNKTAGIAV